MRSLLIFLFSAILYFSQIQLAFSQEFRHCGTPYLHQDTTSKLFSPGGRIFEKWLARIERNEVARINENDDSIYTIPVVVHVLHKGEPIGAGANITDARVMSQINILNQDYGKFPGTPGNNNNPVGVDTRIRFCLASNDPQGNPSTGIVRVNTFREDFQFGTDNIAIKNFSHWDSSRYLNIWVVDLAGNQYIGYAQYPSIEPSWSDLYPFTGSIPDINLDGIVIRHNVFGNVPPSQSGVFPAYNKGRTATHEIGHYFGLLHTWGDGFGCDDPNGTDYCDDTPKQGTNTSGCPSSSMSCISGTKAMIENYLDYTNDACMNTFSADQKKRMRIVIRNSKSRKSIPIKDTSCVVVPDTSKPIPAKKGELVFRQIAPSASNSSFIIELEPRDTIFINSVEVYDMVGRPVNVLLSKDEKKVYLNYTYIPIGVYPCIIRASDGKIWRRKIIRR